MAASLEMRIEPIRSLVAASVGATYTNIGTPLNKPTRMVIIQNETNASVMISFAAEDDHIQMRAGSQIIIDVCTNEVQSQGFYISKETQFKVKYTGVAPTSGSVNITSMYARGS